jgi:poly [ADP-ribose] polymerase
MTNDFFSYIPHDFGFSHMSSFILDTEQKVKQKIEMLESLSEIKIATTILSQASSDENKIDSNYAKLNRNIHSVEKDSSEFKLVDEYLQTTHGRHHASYNLEIADLFRVSSDM